MRGVVRPRSPSPILAVEESDVYTEESGNDDLADVRLRRADIARRGQIRVVIAPLREEAMLPRGAAHGLQGRPPRARVWQEEELLPHQHGW